MTPDDILSRLSAGLDRDEQLARAAAEAAEIENGDWFAGETDHHGIGVFESKEAARRIDYYATAETEHMTEQSPARTLRQVEAIRKVVERYEFVTSHGPAVDNTRAMDMTTGATAALRDVLEILASIYADPAETKEVS